MVVIGTREKDPRLQKLFDEGKNVYSISKCNTIDNCEYEAFCTYKKHLKGENGVYGIMGGKVHDKLEEIMNNKATESELITSLKSEIADLDLFGIDFPKDRNGGTSIRDKWIADMSHFCTNFVKPKGKFSTEQLVLYKLNENRYVQGYIDLIRHNPDGSISIYDWKTSSQFTKEDLLHHGRQLVFYALAKEAEGYKVRNVAWIMLKYCEVSFMGKKRANSKEMTKITKVVNRSKLVEELVPYITADLKLLGYDDIDIECIIHNALQNNEIPLEVCDKYTVKPYVREYEITPEIKDETINYLNKMAILFENKSDNEADWKPKSFYKTTKTGKKQEDTFYCNVLCGHRRTCPHIKKFNDMKKAENETDFDDLF